MKQREMPRPMSSRAFLFLFFVGWILAFFTLGFRPSIKREYITVILEKREAKELLRQCEGGSGCSQDVMRALQTALGEPASGLSKEDEEGARRDRDSNYEDPRRPIAGKPEREEPE